MRNLTIPLLAVMCVSGCFSPGPDIAATGSSADLLQTESITAAVPPPLPTTTVPGSPVPLTSTGATGAASTEDGATTAAPVPTSTSPTTEGADGETTAAETSTSGTTSEPSLCGNSLLDQGEACDDGPGDMLDGCDATCGRSALFAFVTSQVYVGSGLSAQLADEECSNIGAAALGTGFGGAKFKAWFSSTGPQGTATERVASPGNLPYLRLDLEQLSPSPLGKSDLLLPLSVDETGVDILSVGTACENPDSLVWTMSTPAGQLALECAGKRKGTVGSSNDYGPSWSQACGYDCALHARLYCIEVSQ